MSRLAQQIRITETRLRVVFISIILFGTILVASNTQTEAPTMAGVQSTIPVGDTNETEDVRTLRPYIEGSVWNTPIGPDPEYDPHSDEMIATIGLSSRGEISSDPSQFTYPVYFVDESTPRWDIPCTMYSCTVVTPEETSRTRLLENVPIPADAQPSRGHDAQMIIIDATTFAEYNLWQVERTDTGWSISNGSIYNILWDGTPSLYGSRGAGVPYYAGLIRPWEITQGRVEHAIAFGYPQPAADRCVFPATKTDGQSTLPYAIPEGARLQLDPALTEADFDQMGLDRTGKIIARALQEYGMILIDYSGRPKIYAENLENNPYADQQWSDPQLNLTSKTISSIPYTHFRVLALPPAYWDPELEESSHGNCYAFPDSAPDETPANGADDQESSPDPDDNSIPVSNIATPAVLAEFTVHLPIIVAP